MRWLIFGLAGLALAACSPEGDSPTFAEGCSQAATQGATWSSDDASDTITARADGPTCAQAVVTFVIRDNAGDPLWAFASTYYDMQYGGIPPEGAAPVSNEQMQTFLAGWANVEVRPAQEVLPEWRANAATLTESAATFAYDTPFERETYDALRQRNLATLCYAAAVEAVQCLVIDPASHAPTLIVAYGP